MSVDLIEKDLDFGDSNMVDDLLANCNQLRERCWKAESELARWEHIAIEATARGNYYKDFHPTLREDLTWEHRPCEKLIAEHRKRAAEELGIQIGRGANYLKRLEKEFLDLKMNCVHVVHAGGLDEDEIIEYKRKTAQAALDKIRTGR